MRLVAESDARDARHFSGHHVGSGVLLNDDLCRCGQQRLIAAGVIAMLVRIQHVADGLVADGLHLRQNFRCVLREFVVHQQDAFAGGHGRDVAAVGHDDVKIVRDFLHGQRRPLLLRLRPHQP